LLDASILPLGSETEEKFDVLTEGLGALLCHDKLGDAFESKSVFLLELAAR
jgi:hypothetical protein